MKLMKSKEKTTQNTKRKLIRKGKAKEKKRDIRITINNMINFKF